MPAIDTDETRAMLAGRIAHCGYISTCNGTAPSAVSLAFFEFKGEGSRNATENCKNCFYNVHAHTPEAMAKNPRLKCTNFEPHGPYEFDSFYDGCKGWD